MIPLELQDALKVRLEEEFKHQKLKNLKNETVPISIFPQHLPTKDKTARGEESTDNYPCIIIRLADGDQPSTEDPFNTTIQFIVGVVDRESSFQGYRDSITIANNIIQNLKRNPVIANRYELDPSINWAYHDEDSEPYFFSGVETNWSTPKYIREDVEDMI